MVILLFFLIIYCIFKNNEKQIICVSSLYHNKSLLRGESNCKNDCIFQYIYQFVLLWTIHSTERESGDGVTEHAPGSQIVTGKCDLGGAFYCPSPRTGGAMAKRQRERGEREREREGNECHPCSHMSYC